MSLRIDLEEKVLRAEAGIASKEDQASLAAGIRAMDRMVEECYLETTLDNQVVKLIHPSNIVRRLKEAMQ